MKLRYSIPQVIRSKFDRLNDLKKISGTIYAYLINDVKLILRKKSSWERRLQITIEDQYFISLFETLNCTTICTKYRDFQFRLLHNIIVTNQKLKLWKIIQTDMCTFCGIHVETTLHLFCNCAKVKNLWADIELYIITHINPDTIPVLEWSEENILFNRIHPRPNHVVNFVTLIVKQYIYRQRCTGRPLFVTLLIKEIESVMNIEYDIAKSKGQLTKHYSKWSELYVNLQQTNSEIEQQNDFIQLYIQNM